MSYSALFSESCRVFSKAHLNPFNPYPHIRIRVLQFDPGSIRVFNLGLIRHFDEETMIRSHFSLEDCLRSKFREGIHVGNCNFDDNDGICSTRRVVGAATMPACVWVSLPEVELDRSRGLKRKIGCIDMATQMGRKNRIEDDYVMIEAIGKGKFGSVWLCRSRVSGEEYACKTLRKAEESVHREVEIM